MPEAMDKAAVTDLNAELGKLLGATPRRRWNILRRGESVGWAEDEVTAKDYAVHVGGEVVEVVDWPAYSASRDLMAGVEEELERRGLKAQYANLLCRLLMLPDREYLTLADLFHLANAPPDLRARAARDVLKAGEKP